MMGVGRNRVADGRVAASAEYPGFGPELWILLDAGIVRVCVAA